MELELTQSEPFPTPSYIVVFLCLMKYTSYLYIFTKFLVVGSWFMASSALSIVSCKLAIMYCNYIFAIWTQEIQLFWWWGPYNRGPHWVVRWVMNSSIMKKVFKKVWPHVEIILEISWNQCSHIPGITSSQKMMFYSCLNNCFCSIWLIHSAYPACMRVFWTECNVILPSTYTDTGCNKSYLPLDSVNSDFLLFMTGVREAGHPSSKPRREVLQHHWSSKEHQHFYQFQNHFLDQWANLNASAWGAC